ALIARRCSISKFREPLVQIVAGCNGSTRAVDLQNNRLDGTVLGGPVDLPVRIAHQFIHENPIHANDRDLVSRRIWSGPDLFLYGDTILGGVTGARRK